MKVYYKPVGGNVFPADVECSLESFQNLVGGYIEFYPITSDLAIVCNEDAKLKELPYNCTVLRSRFHGNVFLVGRGRDQGDGHYGWKDAPCNFEEAVRLLSGLIKWREES